MEGYEEIHFLVDDVTEEANKELNSVLTQIQDPLAKKRVKFLNQFTRALIRAHHPLPKKQRQPASEDIDLDQYKLPARESFYTPRKERVFAPYWSSYTPPIIKETVEERLKKREEMFEKKEPKKEELQKKKPTHRKKPKRKVTKAELYKPSIATGTQQHEKKSVKQPARMQPPLAQKKETQKQALENVPTKETLKLPELQELHTYEQEKAAPTLKKAPMLPKEELRQPKPLQQQPVTAPPLQPLEKLSLIRERDSNKTVVRAEVHENKYNVLEPRIQPQDIQVLNKLKEDIQHNKALLQDKIELYKKIRKVAKKLHINIEEEEEFMKYRYYLIRNLLNLGPLEPLLHDEKITKIICEGINKPLVVVREGKQLTTNITFTNQETINHWLQTIAEKTYQTVSLDSPMIVASYRDYKIQGTLGTEMIPAKFIITKE